MSRDAKTFITYKDSGVDIDAGDDIARAMRPMVETTRTPRVMGALGGVAGLFRLDFNERLFKKNYTDPVLVSCAGSVGTKLLVADQADRLDVVGVDCVAMTVNDLVCAGGEPLFFVDSLALDKIDPAKVEAVARGLCDGCRRAGCTLLGGETREMPDLYRPGGFDIAGFGVGVVERGRILDGANAQAGDLAVAVAADGLHCNGFGLARRVLLDLGKFALSDAPAELGGPSLTEELLRPTRIYSQAILELLSHYQVKKPIKSIAHVSRGGLAGALRRLLPTGLTLRVKRDTWPIPPIFKLIARTGPVDHLEMYRVFNMGVGMVMVVAPSFAEAVMDRLVKLDQRCWILGKVKQGGPELQWQ
jgi:phosphoribosylformylglycinamidine cyclo-ligase